MRFVFVDRILAIGPGHTIETLKNVTATEDVFADHFPGFPVLPGALIVEAFDQAVQLLIATTYAFGRVGRLRRLSRATFRHLVRPGDQLHLRCERRDDATEAWTVAATAQAEGRTVATATLEFVLEEAVPGSEAHARAERLRALADVLRERPLELARWGTLS